MNQTKIIISEKSANSEVPYDIVSSNISVVNVLLEEGLREEQIHKDALASYYVDYYLAQVENGGLSQYIYNSKNQKIVNDRVAYGLEKINAVKHLQFFNEKISMLDKMPKDKVDDFLSGEYFGENQTRDELNDDGFFNIDEEIIELNSKWLKNHSDTIILPMEKMFVAVEEIVGHDVER